MRGKYESQDHMHGYKDREKLRRAHEAEAVGNTDRATHENQENDVYGPAGPRIGQVEQESDAGKREKDGLQKLQSCFPPHSVPNSSQPFKIIKAHPHSFIQQERAR